MIKTMSEHSQRLLLAMRHSETTTPRLAASLGVSYQAIKKLIDGTSKSLTAENNSKAAKILGVNPDWLASGEGEMLLNDESNAPPRIDVMGEISAGRLKNLLKLIDRYGGASALAKELGVTIAYISQMKSGNPSFPIGERASRKIEEKLGLEVGWLDTVDAPIPDLKNGDDSDARNGLNHALSEIGNSADNLVQMYELIQKLGPEASRGMEVAWMEMAAKTLVRVSEVAQGQIEAAEEIDDHFETETFGAEPPIEQMRG